jgi:hypothetical protein
MKRRDFLAAGAAIGVAEWLGFFRKHGVPGTKKDWGIAKARAQAQDTDRFLIYWMVEGGWDSYSMLGPVHTANNSGIAVDTNGAPVLNPSPPWSQQLYRVKNYGSAPYSDVQSVNGITHGYLAVDGQSLFPDMAVVSSVKGNQFHSGGRWDLHYGTYDHNLSDFRQPDERTVMQAFAEAKGQNFLLPNISWHRWLSDGELDLGQYPDGTGYYENLGPAYAHTIYGHTTAELKAQLLSTGDVQTQARRKKIRNYTDSLTSTFLRGRDGASVSAFASALSIHESLADRGGSFDVSTLFNDPNLFAAFNVQTGDDATTATVVNGNPARSKESPHIRVQAMMAYELMRAKIACSLWLETRDVRLFDSHRSRRNVLDADSNSDQLQLVQDEIWNPLKALVAQLKNTAMPGTTDGTTLWDRTNIVLVSEMSRTIQGDVSPILAETKDDATKFGEILDQDVCQHWHVSSCAFLGANVQGGTQFGRVGSQTLDNIPMMPDGTLDPAFDPNTGVQNGTQSSSSFVADAGHIYATALQLGGVDPTGKGRNTSPAMTFVQKPGV